MTKKIADESLFLTVIKIYTNSSLRKAGNRHIRTILYNFFYLQYKAALFPGRIPVSDVDHPLDAEIPFIPSWVKIYLDFIPFWIRIIGFLLRTYKKDAIKPAADFIDAMSRTYQVAAEVYQKNLSTTERPRYLAKPRFVIIHATDPHLMCIPSLHVMVVVRAYTKFQDIINKRGDAERFSAQTEEIKQGAIKITEAILYIKQHSINCVGASLYAMSKFDPPLLPFAEAEDFTSKLFLNEKNPDFETSEKVRKHIIDLYSKFLAEGENASSWDKPIMDFLDERIIKKDKKVKEGKKNVLKLEGNKPNFV